MAKQQDAAASVKEAAERRKQAEADRLAQLAERQRRKQEAVVSNWLGSSVMSCPNLLPCSRCRGNIIDRALVAGLATMTP